MRATRCRVRWRWLHTRCLRLTGEGCELRERFQPALVSTLVSGRSSPTAFAVLPLTGIGKQFFGQFQGRRGRSSTTCQQVDSNLLGRSPADSTWIRVTFCTMVPAKLMAAAFLSKRYSLA